MENRQKKPISSQVSLTGSSQVSLTGRSSRPPQTPQSCQTNLTGLAKKQSSKLDTINTITMGIAKLICQERND